MIAARSNFSLVRFIYVLVIFIGEDRDSSLHNKILFLHKFFGRVFINFIKDATRCLSISTRYTLRSTLFTIILTRLYHRHSALTFTSIIISIIFNKLFLKLFQLLPWPIWDIKATAKFLVIAFFCNIRTLFSWLKT